MSFPVSISFPPPRPLSSTNAFKHFRERPRGLWKARVTSARISTPNIPDRKEKPLRPISDTDDDETPSTSPSPSSPRPFKRQRREDDSDCSSSSSDEEEALFSDYSPPSWTSYTVRKMDSSSTAHASTLLDEKRTCDKDDWEDLKELFARATEQYEGNDAAEGLPLLRGVIHECHRFLHVYPDPSVLFADPTPTESSAPIGRKSRQGSSEPSSSTTLHDEPRLQHKSVILKFELPTAFHALLGTALFLFGNLIAQEPSLALEGEPTNPVPYWLAALDVFETGENLPSRTSGTGYTNYPEDWRMAIIWGRTLVCLADDLVNRQIQAKQEGEDPQTIYLDVEEPNWPRESPFHAIAAQRQPITRRMSFTAATPNDLLVLAMDQFSRGIFHMPHEKRTQSWPINGSPTSTGESPTLIVLPATDDPFSRARELYTIASEVLLIAEKLEVPSERLYWANWADSVLNQMKMESERDAWRTPVLRSRGRSHLVAGSAFVEAIETALEQGDMDVLNSEEAVDAREDLSMAIDFFERAKAKEGEENANESESPELRLLLAEALVTLANLTQDKGGREALYARAKAEAGSNMDLDFDADDEDEHDKMDETR